MTLASSSSLKVPYDVRPAKQAERRLFLELFYCLSRCGLDIPGYHYIGFGSIFFQDFRMFHRLLGIEKMTSVEGSPKLISRCEFNLPNKKISLFEGMSSDYLLKMNSSENYLIWFDYDFFVDDIVCSDIYGSLSKIKVGSVFIVTIDIELPGDLDGRNSKVIFKILQEDLPNYAMAGLDERDFRPSVLQRSVLRILDNCINASVSGRVGVKFEPLLVLTYADGHKMLTVGGVIADKRISDLISDERVNNLSFIKRTVVSDPIHIPKLILTRKELIYLERYCPEGTPNLKDIGVEDEVFEEFRKFYRFWPSYIEIFM